MKQLKTVRDLAVREASCLGSFRAKGRLLFKEPLEYLIRGIYLDASAFSKQCFYPTVFVQPLYMPKNYIFYTFGGRLTTRKNEETWNFKPELSAAVHQELTWAIQNQALPLLEKITEPLDLALACQEPAAFSDRFEWFSDDINVLEAAAYSWLLAGNTRKASDRLRKIHRHVETGDDKQKWVLELQKRSQQIYHWLQTGEEDRALQQLDKWTKDCAQALGLTRFLKIPGDKIRV